MKTKLEISEISEIAEELKTYNFFRGFPEEALLAFSSMATERQFKPGELLLEQGKNNSCLFFLRQGQLLVQVDGETVSCLDSPGDVVGEMSLINRTPITASVSAQDEVQTFEVNENYLSSLPESDREKFQGLLDRVYASVLAERLTRTNKKAKGFEIANRELAVAQDQLKQMNASLEFEIARRSKELVQKVQSLTETHLRPTQLFLARCAQNASSPSPADFQNILGSVTEVIDFLKPVSDLENVERSAVSKRVLLLDPNKKQQNIARLALGGTGIELSLASDVSEFKKLLAEHDFDAVLCDSELKEAATLVLQGKRKIPLVLLVGLDMTVYLQMLEEFPERVFFVSRNTEDRTFTIKNISTTVTKIINNDLFGIEKYLAWGTRILEEPVSDSAQRKDLIETMTEHFKSLGLRSTLLERVQTAAEELLMNAIYDAPVDANGKSLYNHLARTEQIILPPEQQSHLRFGTDGILLGISVADPFGALTKSVIMRYLDSCYRGQAGSLNSEKGGAGRGLKMLIDSADLTIFNIIAGKKTEVICLFNLDAAANEAQSTFHLFHLA
jgi:CRP-like cAMP-binding protein